MVEQDLEEVNACFDHHRGEINCLKTREKESKEKVEELGGFILGAAHEAEIFKTCLDRMEDNVCKCGRTPSEVEEEFFSSEEEAVRNHPQYMSDSNLILNEREIVRKIRYKNSGKNYHKRINDEEA